MSNSHWEIPICWYCKHFDNESAKQSIFIHKCSAFPDYIPGDIWSNRTLHTKPYPDDNDIQFEVASEPELLDRIVIQKLKYTEANIADFHVKLDGFIKFKEERNEMIRKFLEEQEDKIE